ncbi:uncharacterized protein TNCV_4181711 [Trichonephila clavipes]|nr:uncharacterized protein TNCV_4181711 [Trichonephila clavipes]
MQIIDELDSVHGDSAPTFTTVKISAAEFKRGRKSLGEVKRSGRPNTATDGENIAKFHQMVLDDCRIKTNQRSHITPNAHDPYHHSTTSSFNSPLLACRFHGFMRLSPYPYTSISSIQLETRLVRLGNVFPFINSSMSVLTGTGKVNAFCHGVNKGTQMDLRLPKSISMISRCMVYTVTPFHDPALKSTAICRSVVAHLPRCNDTPQSSLVPFLHDLLPRAAM